MNLYRKISDIQRKAVLKRNGQGKSLCIRPAVLRLQMHIGHTVAQWNQWYLGPIYCVSFIFRGERYTTSKDTLSLVADRMILQLALRQSCDLLLEKLLCLGPHRVRLPVLQLKKTG